MALELIAGSVFGVLYDRVSRAVDRKSEFRYLLTHMKRTLESLKGQARFIREIREFNDELSLPNHNIADLETQMIEGTQLVGRMSSFCMYNYCCLDGCHNQLYELNMSLDRLLGNLQLQQARDVKEILKLSRQNHDDLDEMKGMLKILLQQKYSPEMKGLLKKLLEQNAGDSTEPSTSASGSNTEREENDGAQVESLEAAFRLLFDVVIEVKDKSTLMFGPIIGHLKSTLDCLKPLIEDIAQHNNKALDRPKKELETFGMRMKNGVELVRKCLKFHQWTSNETYKYTSHLFELDESLQRQFSILIVQVARDVKETSVMLRNVRKMVERIEGISTGVAKNQQLKLDVVEANETRDVREKTLVSARNVEAEFTLMDGEVSEPPSVTVGLEDPPEEMRMSGQKPRKQVNFTRKLLMVGVPTFDPYKRKRSSTKERDPNMFVSLKSLPGRKRSSAKEKIPYTAIGSPPMTVINEIESRLKSRSYPAPDLESLKKILESLQRSRLGMECSKMELKKTANNFDLKHALGRGGSGVVYKGLLSEENLEVAVKRTSCVGVKDQVAQQPELNIIKKPCHKHLDPLLEYSSPKDLKSQMKYSPRVYYNEDAEAVKIKYTKNDSGDDTELLMTLSFWLEEEELKESNWVSKNVVEYERFGEICAEVERLILDVLLNQAIDDIVRGFLKLEEEEALSNLYMVNGVGGGRINSKYQFLKINQI